MPEITIAKATIDPLPRPMPQGMFDPTPNVHVTYMDDTTETLFAFYPDEITLTPQMFTGLTRSEALQLRHEKTVQHIQS